MVQKRRSGTPTSVRSISIGFITIAAALAFLTACSNMLTLNPNREPVVNITEAGGVTLYPGNSVTLDASESFDPDGQKLTAAWAVTTQPGSGDAVLSGADTFTPTFSAFRLGTYTLTLTITDEYNVQRTGTATITVANDPPGANAGPNRSAGVVSTGAITIAGTGGDADEVRPPRRDDLWQYRWEMVRQPWAADGQMVGALVVTGWTAVDNFADQNTNQGGAAETGFTPPVDGVYTLRLRVRDEGLGEQWGRESTSTMIVSTANNTPPRFLDGAADPDDGTTLPANPVTRLTNITATNAGLETVGGIPIETPPGIVTDLQRDRLSATWRIETQPEPQLDFRINTSGTFRSFGDNATIASTDTIVQTDAENGPLLQQDIDDLTIVPSSGTLTVALNSSDAPLTQFVFPDISNLPAGTQSNIRIRLRISDGGPNRHADVFVFLNWTP